MWHALQQAGQLLQVGALRLVPGPVLRGVCWWLLIKGWTAQLNAEVWGSCKEAVCLCAHALACAAQLQAAPGGEVGRHVLCYDAMWQGEQGQGATCCCLSRLHGVLSPCSSPGALLSAQAGNSVRRQACDSTMAGTMQSCAQLQVQACMSRNCCNCTCSNDTDKVQPQRPGIMAASHQPQDNET